MSLPFPVRNTTRFGILAETPWLSAAVLIDTAGAGLLLPLSLVYFTLTSRLGLPEIGLIAAIATLFALPGGMVGGVVTDRFGAKASMVTNNVISAVGYTLFLLVHDPVGIFLAIFLTAASERLYWASWISYVHRLAAGRPFERWFSFLEAIKMGALGVGACIAVLVLELDAVSGLWWLGIANVVSSLSAAAVFLGQKLTADMPTPPTEAPKPGVRAWPDVLRGRGAVALLTGQFLLGPLMVLPNVALSVMFISIWHLPAAVSPALFAINTALVALLQAPLTAAMSRIGRPARIWAAACLVAVCLLPLTVIVGPGTAAGWAYVVGSGILLAFADMLYLPPTNAVMVEAPAPHLRGRAVSLFQTAFALSMALYPSTIGLLHSGLPWLLWVITTLAIVGGALSYTIAIRQIDHTPTERFRAPA